MPAVVGLCCGVGAYRAVGFRLALCITFGLCGFAGAVNLRELFWPGLMRARRRKDGVLRSLAISWTTQGRRSGGALVHLAIVVIAAGIAGAQGLRQSAEASLSRGESFSLAPYTFTYEGAVGRQESHRFAAVARVRVDENGKTLGFMEPRLNFYPSQREPVGTPHVVTLGSRDLYLSLLSVEPQGGRITLKVYLIPLVAWLWRSLPLLVLGSMLSLWPRKSALARSGGRAPRRENEAPLPELSPALAPEAR